MCSLSPCLVASRFETRAKVTIISVLSLLIIFSGFAAYMALPAHIEIVCTEEGEAVPKASTPVAQKLTRKQQAVQAKIAKYKQAKKNKA